MRNDRIQTNTNGHDIPTMATRGLRSPALLELRKHGAAGYLFSSLMGIVLAGMLASCGVVQATGGSFPATVPAKISGSTLSWISEPSAGFTPWRTVLRQTRTGVDVNAYLLTDAPYVHDLRQIARRGIPVRIILAANPYHDPAAIADEKTLLAGSRIQWHWAPSRFDTAYATDHAKYLIVNPGTSQAVAIVGSPNGTWSAFGGDNAEDAMETSRPAITTALTQVFQADWTGRSAGPALRHTLVLSPGAQSVFLTLLASSGPVAVTAEELGDAPALYRALAAHGAMARLLVSSRLLTSPTAQRTVAFLRQAGVQVRTLHRPYVHAKLLVTAQQTWVGSQNWSAPSLDNNREVGITTANPTVHAHALAWFNQLWTRAVPWPARLVPREGEEEW
nr:phospholipase D-like domain-containing protein [Sulfobacillus thermotolerans]